MKARGIIVVTEGDCIKYGLTNTDRTYGGTTHRRTIRDIYLDEYFGLLAGTVKIEGRFFKSTCLADSIEDIDAETEWDIEKEIK
jgi:hypothetical protein